MSFIIFSDLSFIIPQQIDAESRGIVEQRETSRRTKIWVTYGTENKDEKSPHAPPSKKGNFLDSFRLRIL